MLVHIKVTCVMADFLVYTDEKTKSQQVLSPEIIRVFTGLFLTVENLAEVCVEI